MCECVRVRVRARVRVCVCVCARACACACACVCVRRAAHVMSLTCGRICTCDITELIPHNLNLADECARNIQVSFGILMGLF